MTKERVTKQIQRERDHRALAIVAQLLAARLAYIDHGVPLSERERDACRRLLAAFDCDAIKKASRKVHGR